MIGALQAQQQTASTYVIPAAVGGMNTRDALTAMPETDARLLRNWFPGEGRISFRKGYQPWGTVSAGDAIKTLANHIAADGTEILIACCDNKMFTAESGSETDITNGQTITIDRWQTLHMNNHLLFYNGADTPLKWDGSSLEVATYTGDGLTPSNLIQGTNYRDRVYILEKDTLNLWYGANVRSITGALEKTDLSWMARKGGYGMFVATWTADDGGGTDDRLVIVTSEGECLIYEGDYPGNTWYKAMQLVLPKPLGRKAYFSMAGELYIITERGIIALSQAMTQGAGSSFGTITGKIDPSFIADAHQYRNNAGWEAALYHPAPMLIVNVPTDENVEANQYVLNTDTGAWALFTGMDALCWCVSANRLFFGASDGVVYQAWTGYQDNEDAIQVEFRQAYSGFGAPFRVKHFGLIQPVMYATTAMEALLDMAVDFDESDPSGAVSVTGITASAWDTSVWDEALWGTARSLQLLWGRAGKLGRFGSVIFKGNYKNVQCDLMAVNCHYQLGGLL